MCVSSLNIPVTVGNSITKTWKKKKQGTYLRRISNCIISDQNVTVWLKHDMRSTNKHWAQIEQVNTKGKESNCLEADNLQYFLQVLQHKRHLIWRNCRQHENLQIDQQVRSFHKENDILSESLRPFQAFEIVNHTVPVFHLPR